MNPLTGLPARAACVVNLGPKIAAASGSTGSLSAIWVDVDRFVSVNRTLGHRAGDQVIRKIAARIRKLARNIGELYHFGGDEFVMLLPEKDRGTLAKIATDLLVLTDAPLQLGAVVLHPTCSIGIATFEPDNDADDLLERADRAMHDAKQQGGNRFVFSGEERVLGRHGILLEREELEIESDLHNALDNGGLELHFQPIVRCDGGIEAIEALMRCTVEGRRISPARLIPVAEKTGLIERLGEWSLVTAADFARRLEDRGYDVRVAVNVSRAQLLSPGFAEALAAALLVTNVEAQHIELEITESLFMDLSAEVRSNLDTCASLGCPLSIDDFGTGFSCLAVLKDLPASKMKLDRAFTTVLPVDQRAYSVVRAMTHLAKELGMAVVAEGVESQEQRRSLVEAGVDAIQGYVDARPMDGESLIKWLEERKR